MVYPIITMEKEIESAQDIINSCVITYTSEELVDRNITRCLKQLN